MLDLNDQIDATTGLVTKASFPLGQHVLCTIQIYANGTIVLEPDFNSGKMAYIVETGALHNEVYHYYLEHASIPISTEDFLKERRLFDEIALRKQTHRLQIVGNEFDAVNKKKKRFVGEIDSI